MKQEHLTPDGWKPCTASTKECKYENRRPSDSSAFISSAVEEVQAGNPNAINNFIDNLDNLFGQVEKSSSKIESRKGVPIEIEPTHIDEFIQEEYEEDDDDEGLNKVVQGEDGQYEVVCLDIQDHDRPRTHRFGDLIKDKAIAERLHQDDPHKHYQLGLCDRLAEELWTYNKHVEEYYVFNDESQSGRHHFVKLKDGTYADSLGIWTEEAFFSKWENNRPTLDGTKVRKNPFLALSTPELFITVNQLIDKHMAGETL